MTNFHKKIFKHSTENNLFKINSYYKYIDSSAIFTNYAFCYSKCQSGCKNFNNKYSCPPYAPQYNNLAKNYPYLIVNAMVINYNDIIPTNKELKKDFNLIKAANVICKSKQRKLFDKIAGELKGNEKGFTILENGSCRLCKSCAKQTNEPCRHPDKARCSLEACGVRVDKLVEQCFNLDLDWYQKGRKDYYPTHQCVVSGILVNQYIFREYAARIYRIIGEYE